MVKQIGQDSVDVVSLLKGTENPHYADANPEFIRLVSNADVVCSVGLSLEIGWLPKVLARSGNAKVQRGGSGFCELGKSVTVLEKAEGSVDRSMGDVHPEGNPHFWLSPKSMAEASQELVHVLASVSPANAAALRASQGVFVQKMNELILKNQTRLRSVVAALGSGPISLEYHREFNYLLEIYGIRSFGSIEEKPGVPPSAGRIAEVAKSARAAGVRFILAAEYHPKSTVERVSELSGIPVITVPTSVQPVGKIKDYIELQDFIVDQILKNLARGTQVK